MKNSERLFVTNLFVKLRNIPAILHPLNSGRRIGPDSHRYPGLRLVPVDEHRGPVVDGDDGAVGGGADRLTGGQGDKVVVVPPTSSPVERNTS